MLEDVAPAPAPTRAGRLPGDVNIWIFILGDLVFFSAYFVIFMVYRHQEKEVFLASQEHLSLITGALNTLVLLTSSRFIALGVYATRSGDHQRARRQFFYGGLCGVAFVGIKAVEWAHEISQGFTLPRNDFFMFYYLLTGIHLFHVLLGIVVLILVIRELRSPDHCRSWVVESGALYWHMVDLLWVVIFALLYVMR